MKNNRKGFTLAELLIVVAIIAVLVAISIPVFSSRLESSREATDIANLRAAYAAAETAALTGYYGDDFTAITNNTTLTYNTTTGDLADGDDTNVFDFKGTKNGGADTVSVPGAGDSNTYDRQQQYSSWTVIFTGDEAPFETTYTLS